MTPLPAQQASIYAALLSRQDVAIEVIYRAVHGAEHPGGRRVMQQSLGSVITKLNRRIRNDKLAVKPGALKGTYRLVSI